jgi:hypothetical protein
MNVTEERAALASAIEEFKAAEIAYVTAREEFEAADIAIHAARAGAAGRCGLISPETGMVGYPTFVSPNVVVKALFNPSVKYQGLIQIQSEIAQPCGIGKLFKLEYDLESNVPHRKWFLTANALTAKSVTPINERAFEIANSRHVAGVPGAPRQPVIRREASVWSDVGCYAGAGPYFWLSHFALSRTPHCAWGREEIQRRIYPRTDRRSRPIRNRNFARGAEFCNLS